VPGEVIIARMERYPVPAWEVRNETLVVNSRFIATLAPAFRVDEAKAFVARIKAEFVDASHNVPAYIIGHGASVITHCNDDGEPSGTAGRPALAVLSGSGLGDAAVVVTRYFGGTKLGTGGLVRAYSDAVRQVLAIAPLAERIQVAIAMLVAPYNWFERLRLLIEAHHGALLDQDFAADITLTARFPSRDFPLFQASLRQASHGSLTAELITTETAIVPYESNFPQVPS
jgi:uncharacterized YigZ family protein